MSLNSNEEIFIVYHSGKPLHLYWHQMPPSLERKPVKRICAITSDELLLITIDNCLYLGNFNAERHTLKLEFQQCDICDIDYCRQSQQIFMIGSNGIVYMQYLNDTQYHYENWQTLILDPLELSEDGVCVRRVCCSSQGVIFITESREIYVMGSCGDIFKAETLPKQFRLFNDNREILDIVGGDDFFVALLHGNTNDELDELGLLLGKEMPTTSRANRVDPSITSSPNMKIKSNHLNGETNNHSNIETRNEINSNASLQSFSINSTNSQLESEHDHEWNIRDILREGYTLLHTQIYTFGGQNNGILGTGDHSRRTNAVKLQKLDGIGVCNIASGREHTIIRTLDGRLFHWGLNTKQQLNNHKDINDLSTPTELKMDQIELDVIQRNIIQACCGDYHTVLLNARNELHDKDLTKLPQNFLTLQINDNVMKQKYPLILATDQFTLYNRREFQLEYHYTYTHLQDELRKMLKYRDRVQNLQMLQQRTQKTVLTQMQPMYLGFKKILYLLAANLKSLESFYRGDEINPAELLFIKYYRECILLLDKYGKGFCDLYAIDNYNLASRYFEEPNNMITNEKIDLATIFQHPLQITSLFVQFLEKLIRSRTEFAEHLLAWKEFQHSHDIELELAKNTQNFWQRNEYNSKVNSYKRKFRRVILTSTNKPLKLSSNGMPNIIMINPMFILFSDCLCQVGIHIYTFPLTGIWVKIENDYNLCITTPEKSFTLTARSHDDKKLWYDTLVSSILAALKRSPDSKLSSVRTTVYSFSKNHAKYAGVRAYGRWRNGVMHGNCYLEYPDGKIYFGEMRNSEIEGYGKMVIPSFGIYEGTFKAGKFHGYGKLEMKDDEIYEGNFRDGRFHGHGCFRAKHYTYVGEYQAHTRCGYGILDDTYTGDKYMGMFVENKRTGAGTCITMNGDYFEGIFTNDELTNTGIAVFENGYYYEGDLTLRGPNGKGVYYIPTSLTENTDLNFINDFDEFSNRLVNGIIMSGVLGGNWKDVRIINGNMSLNREFNKYSKSIGDQVVDNNRKWRALFDDFEEEILGKATAANKKTESTINPTRTLWTRIAIYITTHRERKKAQQETENQSTKSYFAKNISLGLNNSSDKVSLKSTSSLVPLNKSSFLDLSGNLTVPNRAYSQETLYDTDDLNDSIPDFCNSFNYSYDHTNLSSLLNTQFGAWVNDSVISNRSSFDLTLNSNNDSFTSQNGLEIVPSFGINSLNEHDVNAIKHYLAEAFRDSHHPLYILNQRIANCFYTSYGCWKMKPTPILAKQAVYEWESISKRVYKFVRKMFPALPEEYCVIESTGEVVSHITLLYPIVLSDSIYSTLFVLYANKYSRKDEIYRKNLFMADKLSDTELAESLGLKSSLLSIICHPIYQDAIQTLKKLKERYSPKEMLTVIETCMQKISDASNDKASKMKLDADCMADLTHFLVLRAAVPHLGAELALLGDLTGGENYEFEMSGKAGYCYITLKGGYELIAAKSLHSKT